MNNSLKKSLIAAVVLASLSAIALPASARGVIGAAGRASAASDYGCFSESWGTFTNICQSAKWYVVSLPIDSVGSKTVWVNAYGASSNNNVQCNSISQTADANWYWGSPFMALPAFGSDQTIGLNGSYVPAMGTLMVSCLVNPGGTINSVSYDP